MAKRRRSLQRKVKKTKKANLKGKVAPPRDRIIEVAIALFAELGHDGTSVRAIAKGANVNLAAVNYHFKSKKNLLQEVMSKIISEFKDNIKSIGGLDDLSVAKYAVKVFEVLIEDGTKCINQFKLYIGAENFNDELDPYPIGFEHLSMLLKHELKDEVPLSARLWANNIIFAYVIHMAVMSSSQNGKSYIEKYHLQKENSVRTYIEQLVQTLIRDLNNQY